VGWWPVSYRPVWLTGLGAVPAHGKQGGTWSWGFTR